MFKEGRDSFPKIFISHKIEVRESSIHGLGVFAKERLEKNELVEAAPIILFHRDTCEVLGAGLKSRVSLDPDIPLRLEGVHDRHVLMDYPFEWSNKMMAFGLGYAGIYNHSTETPNARWRPNFEYESIDISTKCVVEPGEEITMRYVAYKHCGTLWFVSDEPNRKLDAPLELDSKSTKDIIIELSTLQTTP